MTALKIGFAGGTVILSGLLLTGPGQEPRAWAIALTGALWLTGWTGLALLYRWCRSPQIPKKKPENLPAGKFSNPTIGVATRKIG